MRAFLNLCSLLLIGLAPPSRAEMPSLPVRIDTPMGVLLRDLGPASIGSPLSRGAFFGCMPDCRVHGEDQAGPALAAPVIARAPKRGGPYTHVVELGRTSASLPALGTAR